jgi:GGDEF domain-containing protein
MNREFLALDYKTPVTLAGKLAMSREDSSVYDFITVTAQGRYYGIVTIRDLLNKTIEIEVNNATQLNPLTALPGNMAIETALAALLFERREGHVLYFDIDHFKAYNDVYGFENGDRVIKHLARAIAEALPEGAFLGHVGGDDFVAIVSCGEAPRCAGGSSANSIYPSAIFIRRKDVYNGYIQSRKTGRALRSGFPDIPLHRGSRRASEPVCGRIFPFRGTQVA